MEQQVVKYNINEAEIAKMSDIYMRLTIKDIEDKEAFDAVHTARMTIVKHRTSIDKLRKSANADAQVFIKKNNADAKALLSLMEPIETHLTCEERKVTDELKRLKEEAERKEQEKIEARLVELAKYNCMAPFMEVATLSDDEYNALFAKMKENYEIEQKRLADEESARIAENVRLKKQAKAQEDEALRLADIQKEIDRKKQALKDEQERLDRIEFERIAEENAKIEANKVAEEQRKREALEKVEREKAEAEEKKRQEALLPDKSRLLLFAEGIRELIGANLNVESIEARKLLDIALKGLANVEETFRKGIESL